jgi:hypothetical protein
MASTLGPKLCLSGAMPSTCWQQRCRIVLYRVRTKISELRGGINLPTPMITSSLANYCADIRHRPPPLTDGHQLPPNLCLDTRYSRDRWRMYLPIGGKMKETPGLVPTHPRVRWAILKGPRIRQAISSAFPAPVCLCYLHSTAVHSTC